MNTKSIVFLFALLFISTLVYTGTASAERKVHEIDISGSPFKGPVAAPVVIVVFSDFQ